MVRTPKPDTEERKLEAWEEVESRWDEVIVTVQPYKNLKPRRTFTMGQFAEAIKNSDSVISSVASVLDLDWLRVRDTIRSIPCLQAYYDAEKESMLDTAELVVQNNIRASYINQTLAKQQAAIQAGMPIPTMDTADARWFLSRLGKHRGYGEQVSIDLSAEKPIPIVVIQPGELDALLPKDDE